MQDLSEILKSKTTAACNKNLHSEAHYWADVISKYFGERKKFAMYLGIIKRIGIEETKKIFVEIKDSNCKSPAKLFFWKTKKNIPPKIESTT